MVERELMELIKEVAERTSANDRAILELVQALIDKVLHLEVQLEALKQRV